MSSKIHLGFILLFSQICFGQDSIVSFDRPGIADSPYIVNKSLIQLESGVACNSLTGLFGSLLPSVMIRKGLFRNNEIRLTFNYDPQMMKILKHDLNANFDPLALGFKQKLISENKFIPETSLLVNTFFPMELMQNIFKSGIYNVEVGLQFQNNLNKLISLNYNFGGIKTDYTKNGIFYSSFCTNFSISKKCGFFTEGFSYTSLDKEKAEMGFDLGGVFSPTNFSQIDFSIIDNIQNTVQYVTFSIGYSHSFRMRN